MVYKKRKLVCGAGVNDALYSVAPKINGKAIICPYYRTWSSMLNRSYNLKYHKDVPTYKGVVVCEDWHSFMNFKSWMITQDWEGKHLDKDIINPGNKEYGPDTCVFVSPQINSLMTDRRNARGKYLIGVNWYEPRKKFRAQCNVGNGTLRYLGYFDTEKEAHEAYKKCKINFIRATAQKQTNNRIKRGLLKHAALLGAT